jgi:hypothetical protein
LRPAEFLDRDHDCLAGGEHLRADPLHQRRANAATAPLRQQRYVEHFKLAGVPIDINPASGYAVVFQHAPFAGGVILPVMAALEVTAFGAARRA